MTRIAGATETALRQMLGRADLTNLALADARLSLASSPPSGAMDSARLALKTAKDELDALRALLSAALEAAPWCDGCGDGKPGVMRHVHGGDFPCPVCVAEEIERLAPRVVEPERRVRP